MVVKHSNSDRAPTAPACIASAKQARPHARGPGGKHGFDLHHCHTTGQPLSFTRRKRLRHSDACNFAFGNPARFREFVGLFKALQAKRVTIVWLRPNATAELEQIVATPAAATPAQTLAGAPHFHSFWISAGRIGWRLFPSHRTSFTFSTKGTSR